jgi:hypothetical protein
MISEIIWLVSNFKDKGREFLSEIEHCSDHSPEMHIEKERNNELLVSLRKIQAYN